MFEKNLPLAPRRIDYHRRSDPGRYPPHPLDELILPVKMKLPERGRGEAASSGKVGFPYENKVTRERT